MRSVVALAVVCCAAGQLPSFERWAREHTRGHYASAEELDVRRANFDANAAHVL